MQRAKSKVPKVVPLRCAVCRVLARLRGLARSASGTVAKSGVRDAGAKTEDWFVRFGGCG